MAARPAGGEIGKRGSPSGIELKYNDGMESIYTDGSYLKANPGWHSQDGAWKLTHVQRALAVAGVAAALSTVCDIGCGSGELVKTWARQRPDMQFTGCEISPQAYALCVQNAPGNVRFVQGDAPVGGPFDAVLAVDVMEHVPEPEKFLDGLHKLSDIAVLHVPLDLSFRTLIKPEILEEERRSVGHIHFYTAAYLKRFLHAQGYEILSWHYTNKYVERPPQLLNWRSRVGMCIRRLAHYGLPRAWAAWWVGGYSVMLVARRVR